MAHSPYPVTLNMEAKKVFFPNSLEDLKTLMLLLPTHLSRIIGTRSPRKFNFLPTLARETHPTPAMKLIRSLIFCGLMAVLFLTSGCNSLVASDGVYQLRKFHSPDGIGKFYMGREIARVMGHRGALWLERPSREAQEKTSQVVDALELQPNAIVADIGAGTGYLTFRIAPQIPDGKVYAVDIQPEMLDMVDFMAKDNGVANVETVLGDSKSPNLAPASIDVALMVDAYHEFEYPQEMMRSLRESLKPGGRVVLVEYRRENPLIPIKTLHKMRESQVRQELAALGFQWRETREFLPQQHFIVFEKG